MKNIYFLALVFIVFGCSSGDKAEEIRENIRKHKDKINILNNKISALEKELEEISGSENEKYKVLVKLDTLVYRSFKHYFEASGVVESINDAFISPEINGQIKEIYVTEGDHVTKGQLLAKLNTSIIENTIDEVKTAFGLANTIYKKQKQLWDKKIGSEMQYLEAKNNKEAMENKLKTLEAQLEMAYIRSPINGIVDEIYKKDGELAIPGMQLMQIVNLKNLYINADISESYLPSIKQGDIVYLSFPSFPDFSMEVPIRRIGNVINPDNRTFIIQLKIDNREDKLKPNTLSVIKINDFSTNSAIVAPSIIIKDDINGSYLYIAKASENGFITRKVYIETGISYGNETMVVKGLEPGQLVITKGYNKVSDGTEIKTH
jgi:RND family efflux transporter MFP subunit